MRCPFCESPLANHPREPQTDTQESGGTWRVTEYDCPQCGAWIWHDVVFKVGHAREAWKITVLPRTARTRGPLHCPVCDEALVSAWPPDALAEPATGFGTQRSNNVRETDHFCVGCRARYRLREHVESTWVSADGTPIEPPRRFSRR